MYDFFNSTLLSNIIGAISLIISCLSLYFSCKTFKTADEIKKDIRESQIKVLDRRRFNEEKAEIYKRLQKIRDIISSKPTLSYTNTKNVYKDICTLTNFNKIFSSADYARLCELRNKQEEICRKKENREHIPSTEHISIITDVLGIINKGDYDI